MRTFEGCPHDFNISSAIKRVIDTPGCHGSRNVTLNFPFYFLWIDTIGSSQLFGHFEFGMINVDSDDLGCSRFLCALNDGKSLNEEAKLSTKE
jgi:hypothetical protein